MFQTVVRRQGYRLVRVTHNIKVGILVELTLQVTAIILALAFLNTRGLQSHTKVICHGQRGTYHGNKRNEIVEDYP